MGGRWRALPCWTCPPREADGNGERIVLLPFVPSTRLSFSLSPFSSSRLEVVLVEDLPVLAVAQRPQNGVIDGVANHPNGAIAQDGVEAAGVRRAEEVHGDLQSI